MIKFVYNLDTISKKIILYGSGGVAVEFIYNLRNNVKFLKNLKIVDDFNNGKYLRFKNFKIKILNPKILKDFDDYQIILTSRFYNSIKKKIKKNSFLVYWLNFEKKNFFSNKNILNNKKLILIRKYLKGKSKILYNHCIKIKLKNKNIENFKKFHAYLKKNIFGNQYMSFLPKKIGYLVDIGFYNGVSTRSYLKIYKKIDKIYAIDATPKNYKDIRNLKLFKCAAGNKNTKIDFYIDKLSPSSNSLLKNSRKNTKKINIKRLDDLISFLKPNSIIKMDIEGGELNALKGVARLIREFRPYLAISIYHSKNDIINVPSYLITNYSNIYNFEVRHYSFGYNETVMYAIPKKIN